MQDSMVARSVVSLKVSSILNYLNVHKNIKDEACSMYKTMIKPRVELFKNRGIEYGKDWIDCNQRGLNGVRSLKHIVSNNKRYFNKHLDEQRKGLLDAQSNNQRLPSSVWIYIKINNLFWIWIAVNEVVAPYW